MAEVTYGPLTGTFASFKGRRAYYPEQQQTLQRIGVGGDIERQTQENEQKAWLSDWSGGLVAHTGIADWRQALNLIYRNEGLQCRAGVPVLPYAVTNQSSVTSDESIASKIASNWRRHEVRTSLDDTEERTYVALGHKVYRNVGGGNSALEVCFTTTDLIIGMAIYNVNGAEKLTIHTYGATNDVEYVADPTGTWSGNMTTLIALNAGDWVIPLGRGYYPTIGPAGINAMIGEIAGSSGVWWMDTTTAAAWTMNQLVLKDGKDDTNTNNSTLDTGAVLAYKGLSVEYGGFAGQSAHDKNWQNPSRITTDNASYASQNMDDSASELLVGLFDLRSYLPPGGAEPVGIEFSYDRYVGGHSGYTKLLCLLTGLTPDPSGSVAYDTAVSQATPSLTGANQADEGTTWATSVENIVAGSSTDLWGTDLTLSQLRDPSFGVALGAFMRTAGTSSADTLYTEAFKIKVYYRPTGTMIALPTGGYAVEHNPVFPHRACLMMPKTSDETAITTPREMWFIDLEWDTDGQRPVMSLSQPNEGMPYVWQVVPFQGGYAICGGAKAGDRGVTLKHLTPGSGTDRDSDQLRDFAFPAVHGTQAVMITMMYAQGSWLILGVTDTDSGDFQWWYWNAGKYHADTILQSLTSLAIAAEPIPVASGAINTQDARIYCIFPNSSDTAVRREFIPPDLSQDPRLVNTSEARMEADADNNGTEDRALRLVGLEQNFGPEEAKKAIANVLYGGRHISAASSAAYSSVTVDLDTAGDPTFTSAAVSHEFTSAFESYDVPTSGVAYTSVIPRVGLKRDLVGSGVSPDGAPILITTVQAWPHKRNIYVLVDEYTSPDWFTFIDSMYSISETKTTQPLTIGDRTFNVTFHGPMDLSQQSQWPLVPDRGEQLGEKPFEFLLLFQEAPGTT